MSVLDKFSSFFGSAAPGETVAEFNLSSNPVIAQSEQLFSAEFERDGADLVLSNFGQSDIRIPDYFHSDSPADIHTADGKILSGDVVEKLAGPEFPGQYAQAGTASNADPIGQVEAVSGTVTVQRASGVRETLSVGAKVFTNDVVQTADGGSLSLTFVDGTIFTLAESSRMVLDSMIYDPAGSQNSGVFNLVEGSFVFIAGEVAKTGGMEVKTPAATMGIRGTTVLVRINATNGEVEVEVSLNQDPDGVLGQFTITGLDGSVIADVNSTATKWLISPVEGRTREITRTPEELAEDQAFLNAAFSAHQIANQRVDDGGEYVETDAGGPQTPQIPDDDLNAPQDAPPIAPDNETPDPNPEEDDRRGDRGSGIDTELANDRTRPDTIDDGIVITTLVTGGDITPIDPFVPTVEPVAPIEDEADVIPQEPRLVDPINTTPEIIPPTQETVVLEDGSVILQGFNIVDPQDDILTVRISAGSTLTLSTGSGVTIVQGTGVDESFTIIQGTGAQITDALNGAIYRPTADADVSGTLTVEVSDGEFSTTQVMVIDIIPVQDAPVAQTDELRAGQNATGITGNLLANDYDVDTNPAFDQLTVGSVTIDGVTHDLNGGTILVTLAGGAQFTIAPDGSYVFDTNNAYAALGEGQIHNDTIEYTLSDGHETDHGQTVTGQINVEITGVNDAPVLSGDGLISVSEGQTVTLTQTDLHAQDVDNTAPELVYTLTSVPANGHLELAGASGTPITSFTQQQIDDGQVVYVHNGSTGTDDTFTFTVTDGIATVNGDVDVAITQINDDPSGTGLPTSLTITEDTAASLDLSSLELSDPDAEDSIVTLTLEVENADISAQSTSSVTVTVTTNGLIIEGSLADLNAALSDSNFITLTPDQDVSGTGAATVTVSVNDNGNTGVGGGGDIDIGTIAVNITPTNDAPVITATGGTTDYTEGDQPTTIATAISIDDPDAGDVISGATVSISGNFEVGDILGFVDTNNIFASYDPATGILTLTGNDSAAAYEAALQSIVYSSTSENPSEQTRTISFQVADGDGALSDVEVGASVEPDAINDAPVIAPFGDFYITEDETTEITFSGTPITDVDAGNGEVTLTFNVDAGSLDFPAGTGITISGNTLTGTIADLNEYLVNGGDNGDFITYTPALNDNNTITLTMTVNDQGNSGGPALTDTVETTINIDPENDAPVLTASGGTTDYTEGDQPTTIATSISIDDPDAGDVISGATVSISGNFEVGDILGFVDTNNISASYDPATGILTLTGNDSAAAYEAALQSIVYSSTSENPSEQPRTISFQVADGDGALSDIEVGASVEPDAVNDAPVIATLDEFEITAGETGELTFSGTPISDVDAGDGEVTLTLSVDNGTLDFPPGTGITISGNTLTGTIANINQYLVHGGTGGDPITFTPTLGDTSPVTLTLTVNDQGNSGGPALTDTENTTININSDNAAPVLTASGGTTDYTEGDQPTTIATSISIDDPDAGDVISGATVSISGNFEVGDILSFASTSNITASYDPATGILTLTGNDSAVAYEAALQSIVYSSTSENPSEQTRTISFQVADGDGALSDVEVGASVEPDAINDAPVIATLGDFYITEDETTEITFSGTPITDVDAGNSEVTLTFNVDAGSLDFPAGTGITISGNTLTGTIADLNEYLVNGGDNGDFITYTPALNDNNTITLTMTVNDQGNSGGPALTDTVETTINIDPENDAPVLTASGGTTDYTEGDQPTTIATTISIDDPDVGDVISGATVSISDNFEVGDILGFVDTNNISASYDPATGILTLTGNDSAAAYEAALQSIVYSSTSENPSEQTRTISFQVADGDGALSDIEVGASVEPDAINDAPVIAPFGDFYITEDETTEITFSGTPITDVDAGNGEVTLTFNVDAGSLDFPAGTGITISGNTLTGTIADLNEYLVNGGDNGDFITYTPALNDNNTITLSLTVNDQGNSGGPALTDTVETTINIDPENDAPVLTASGGTTDYTEGDQPTTIATSISIDDPDLGDVISEATVSISGNFEVGDILSFASTSNITASYDPATGILTLTGNDSAAAYEAALQSIVYSSTSENPSEQTRTISFQVTDEQGELSDIEVGASVQPDAINDAPVIDILPEFDIREDEPTGIIFNSNTISDVDAGNGEVTLTITVNTGSLTFPPGTGITISGHTLTGTIDNINQYLRNGGDNGDFILYTPVQDDNNSATLTLTVNDQGNSGGAAQTHTVNTAIHITSDNDAPVLTISSPTQSYDVTDNPVVLDEDLEVGDVDNVNLQGAEVTIASGLEAPTDLLSFTAVGNITGSYDSATGVLTLTGEDTLENYQTVLRSVEFSSTATGPSDTDRVIEFEVDDGQDTSNIGTVTVSVDGANDALGINLDDIAASPEFVINGGFETGTTFTGGGSILSSGSTDITNWTVIDDDVHYIQDPSGNSVGEGERGVNLNGDEPGAISTTLTTVIGQTYEVSFQGRSDGTLEVLATGGTVGSYATSSDANGLYQSYTFTATAALTTLTFTSTSPGAFGSGLDDVTMREVVGATVDAVEDTPIEISDIQITDPDADFGDVYTVTLSSNYGLITVNSDVVSGLDFSAIDDNGTYTVTLTGTLFQINQTLSVADGVIYTPNLDFNGVDTIDVVVNGPGGGSTPVEIASDTITINVQDVDDSVPSHTDIGDIVEGDEPNLTGIQLLGDTGDSAGYSVSNVGDINNDGIDDFAVGSKSSSGESGTPTLSGSVYVIYGAAGANPYASLANANGEVDLDSLAANGRGFELVGAASGDGAGFSVSGGGDLNNDGISDIVVGAHFVDSPFSTNSGGAYVIYGGQDFGTLADSTTGEISLDRVGVAGTGNLDGFEINHFDSNAEFGYDVNLTGDLNNDGIADLIVSSSDQPGLGFSGTWVVFGGQDFASSVDPTTGGFDVASIGNGVDGFVLQGEVAGDFAGLSVDVVSDFNGDGVDDLLIGAPGHDGTAMGGGVSYVIYGGQDWVNIAGGGSNPTISLSNIGTGIGSLGGFRIESDSSDAALGTTVSNAGDVNGDGIGDLLVTAAGNAGAGTPGTTYVVYGGQNLTGTVLTSTIGVTVGGAAFTEPATGELVTHATALGDINGDGYSDILVGVELADDVSNTDIGRAYVIYGDSAPSTGTHSLADVGTTIDGFQLMGESANDLFGDRAQSVGDVNSDGYNDFIVTATGNDDGGTRAGTAYLVYGSNFDNRVDQVAGADEETGSAGRNIIHGTSGDDVINGGGGGDIITTGAGDDIITIGDGFIDFIDAGSGTDTLVFGDAGSFDLTNINDLRIQSIEALDTTNGLVNDVTLSITDIFQISDDANAELETLLDNVLPTSFVIDADANDTYTLENGSAGGIWTLNTSLSAFTPDHNVYEYVEGGSGDVLATLAIDDEVTPTIV